MQDIYFGLNANTIHRFTNSLYIYPTHWRRMFIVELNQPYIHTYILYQSNQAQKYNCVFLYNWKCNSISVGNWTEIRFHLKFSCRRKSSIAWTNKFYLYDVIFTTANMQSSFILFFITYLFDFLLLTAKVIIGSIPHFITANKHFSSEYIHIQRQILIVVISFFHVEYHVER